MGYGFDGDISALEWAKLCGFHNLREVDKKRLIQDGYFTPCGQRTEKQPKVEIPLPAS